MRRLKTVCEMYCAPRASGKTTRLIERAWYLSSRGSVRGAIYFDCVNDPLFERLSAARRLEEDVLRVSSSPSSIVHWARAHGRHPRITVARVADDMASFDFLVKWSTRQGDMVLVVDEAHNWLPARGPRSDELARVVRMGRHLPTADGGSAPTHLVMASQRPKDLHVVARDNVSTVVCGRVRGESNRSWVRDEYGSEALAAVEDAAPFTWTVLEPAGGELPRVSPLPELRS